MRTLRVGSAAVALALLGAGCLSGASRDTASSGVCASPAGANTFDAATSTGCEPEPGFQICEVPSGATPNPDGTYTPPATCSDPCAPGGYALRCTAPMSNGAPPTVPTPEPSLHCAVLPLPTPPNQTIYCCACAAGG